MATSPPAGSPPLANLTIPRKRSSIGTGGPNSAKRRKGSLAGPSHLRQTSFPPEGNRNQGSRSPSVDSNTPQTPSVISGPGGRKRKGKKSKDDTSVTGSASLVEKPKSANGTATGSALNGAGGDEDADGDDDEIDEVGAMVEGGKMSEAAQKQEREHLAYAFPTIETKTSLFT
jgi:hypothetical protein